MTVILKTGKMIMLRMLLATDVTGLQNYFNKLSPETKQRFGPHPFDESTIHRLCRQPPDDEWRFIALDTERNEIIAYAIIKKGYLPHDAPRLSSYGLDLSQESDCTFAPSVADAWQSSGLGSRLFEYIMEDLKPFSFKRIILWGGVQCSNEKAVKFYQKYGFNILGEFEYNGKNYDMALSL